MPIPQIPRDRAARLALLRRGLIPWLAGIDPDTGCAAPPRRPPSEIPAEARPLIDLLVEQRLLATDVAKDTGETTIEPAHEALLRQWGLLQGWLAEDAGLLGVLDGVKRASRDWAANGKAGAWLTHTARAIESGGEADPGRIWQPIWSLQTTTIWPPVGQPSAQRGGDAARAGARRSTVVAMVAMVAGLVVWFNQSPDGGPILAQQRARSRPFAEAERALQPGAPFWECAKSEKNIPTIVPRW